LLIYDITDWNSFEKLEDWLKECRLNLPSYTPIYIAGNKADLEEQRVVQYMDAEE
jgi:GTPase SAR1 family protein